MVHYGEYWFINNINICFSSVKYKYCNSLYLTTVKHSFTDFSFESTANSKQISVTENVSNKRCKPTFAISSNLNDVQDMKYYSTMIQTFKEKNIKHVFNNVKLKKS